jgi:transglutaminase-like putative cysteine protease
LLIRQGTIRAEDRILDQPQAAGAAPAEPLFKPRGRLGRPGHAEPRRFRVLHRTVYRYARPVERSMHLLRLFPVHDRLQSVLENDLQISVGGPWREYEDVFGNRVRRIRLETTFDQLSIEARSLVEVKDSDPLSFRPLRARTALPLVWMPWHRHMLHPYLMPPELAESELTELTDYAMSFAARNDYNLLDTLVDINATIFAEYQYVPGATTLSTSTYQVYCARHGVCQDFTNLFICLMRLLGIPARYVCGYVYTGPKHPNQRQSEASHAWAQVYLPEVGWKGFDPTNGVITQTDHVRVAVGRVYGDATPTSGTIFGGGGGETLEVDVRVEPAES